MAKIAINRKHWKAIMFGEDFLAETKGRGISEFNYGGCVGTYNGDEEEEEHASESVCWSLKKTQYGLSTPDVIPICKCTTHIHYNYAVLHPETNQASGCRGIGVHQVMNRGQVAQGVPIIQEGLFRQEQILPCVPTIRASQDTSRTCGGGWEGGLEDKFWAPPSCGYLHACV
jgi:hypothetical protein